MGGGTILIDPSFLAEVRKAVFECFFNRADHAFLFPPLVGSVTGVAGFGLEFIIELFVISDQFIVAVLDRDDTGDPFEKTLVFIALPVQFGLLFIDFFAHLVNRGRQVPHFISLIHFDMIQILAVGNQTRAVDHFLYRPFHKPHNKKYDHRRSN